MLHNLSLPTYLPKSRLSFVLADCQQMLRAVRVNPIVFRSSTSPLALVCEPVVLSPDPGLDSGWYHSPGSVGREEISARSVSGRPPWPPAHFCWEPQVCIKSSLNFHSIIGKCIKINVVSVHFSVTTLFKYKTTFEVTDPPARASHHVMAKGGTVPYFIDLGNREIKSD